MHAYTYAKEPEPAGSRRSLPFANFINSTAPDDGRNR